MPAVEEPAQPREFSDIIAEMLEGVARVMAAAAAELKVLPSTAAPRRPVQTVEVAKGGLPLFPPVAARHRRPGLRAPGSKVRNPPTFPRETFEAVVIRVCWSMGNVPLQPVLGASRQAQVIEARHYSMWILRQAYQLSLPLIGDLFSKDHSTVSNALKRVNAVATTDVEINRWLQELMQAIVHEVPSPIA